MEEKHEDSEEPILEEDEGEWYDEDEWDGEDEAALEEEEGKIRAGECPYIDLPPRSVG